jgi:RNA polymerase sigma-70 factor (ECF subfamily)
VESRPPETAELVRRAQRGDSRAYEEIVRAHQDIAFRTAYLITGSAEDAEEAAQEAFVKAYAALGRFEAHRPLRPWLLRIVANEARNRARASRRRAALAVRAAAADLSGDAAPSPEGSALDSELRRALLAAVEALREEERLVIACRYFAGLSEDETAAALGIRAGTVKSRTSRALTRLRERLGERP